MEIETLKRAAEWMGLRFFSANQNGIWVKDGNKSLSFYNPHEDTNLLKKMIAKLNCHQKSAFGTSVCKSLSPGYNDYGFPELGEDDVVDVLMLSNQLLFEIVMEVIDGN